MSEDMKNKKGTILLLSGDMDKALVAFIIATGYAAMGVEMKMWFILWGTNCLKKRRSWWDILFKRRVYNKEKESHYRVLETDNVFQNMVELLNQGGANHIPLSTLNLMGAGPIIFNQMLKRKSLANVEQLIEAAVDLGVTFTICQICMDALGTSVDDLIVPAEVKGVSDYMQDTMNAHYNVII